jgi:hypothetical protein
MLKMEICTSWQLKDWKKIVGNAATLADDKFEWLKSEKGWGGETLNPLENILLQIMDDKLCYLLSISSEIYWRDW